MSKGRTAALWSAFATRTVLFCVFVICTNGLSSAQGTFVVPKGADLVEGNEAAGWGSPSPIGGVYRVQNIISPAAFPQLPPVGVWLNAASLRLDSGSGLQGGGTKNFSSLNLVLSTFTKPFDALSLDFDKNTGPDAVSVFSGSKSFAIPVPSTVPSPFNITVDFQRPFFYNPASGSLVFDLSSVGLTDADGYGVDFFRMGLGFTIQYIFQDGPPFGGVNSVGGGMAIQFDYSDVPEPSVKTIFFVGIVVVVAFTLKRKSKGSCMSLL